LSLHLRATAAGHELLLEAAAVRHVSEARQAAAHAPAWAGRDLVLLDLVTTLGGDAAPSPERVFIVYAAGDTGDDAVMLAVDEIKGLVTVAPHALMKLPAISARFAQLFDAIAVEPIDGCHPLRLRAPLDGQAIGPHDA